MGPGSSRRHRDGHPRSFDLDGWLTLACGTQQEQAPSLSYSCPYCSKTFLTSQAFGRHTLSHQRERDIGTGDHGAHVNGLDRVTQPSTMPPPSHGPTEAWFVPGVTQGLPPWLQLAAAAARSNIVPPYYYPNHLEGGLEIGNNENLVKGLNVRNTEGRTAELADCPENVGSGTAGRSMELDLTLRL